MCTSMKIIHFSLLCTFTRTHFFFMCFHGNTHFSMHFHENTLVIKKVFFLMYFHGNKRFVCELPWKHTFLYALLWINPHFFIIPSTKTLFFTKLYGQKHCCSLYTSNEDHTLFFSMYFQGNTLFSMHFQGNSLFSMHFQGNSLFSSWFHGNILCSMHFHGKTLFSIHFYGNTLFSVQFHGYGRDSLRTYRCSQSRTLSPSGC